MPIDPQHFLGLPLKPHSETTFLDELMQEGLEGTRASAPWRVAYLNAATVNLAFKDAEYARLMHAMDCLYADGQAVVWGARRGGMALPGRVNAGDFTRDFVIQAAARGLRLALVGGQPGIAAAAAKQFQAWAPELKPVFVSDGFFGDNRAVLLMLDKFDPDIVLLGMGSPWQEKIALDWSSASARPRVWWCVGALFEYYSGTRRRAPVWMRRLGLEWAFRLALEPGRLWRRYLIGNPQFVWRVLRGRPVR